MAGTQTCERNFGITVVVFFICSSRTFAQNFGQQRPIDQLGDPGRFDLDFRREPQFDQVIPRTPVDGGFNDRIVGFNEQIVDPGARNFQPANRGPGTAVVDDFRQQNRLIGGNNFGQQLRPLNRLDAGITRQGATGRD